MCDVGKGKGRTRLPNLASHSGAREIALFKGESVVEITLLRMTLIVRNPFLIVYTLGYDIEH